MLTPQRIINLLRAEISFALSLIGIVRVRHLPTFVSVEPANRCQLRCPECPVGRAPNDERRADGAWQMTEEVFERVLNETKTYAHTMQFYFQGEPLLNKKLPSMIQRASQAGLYTIVSTNAQALTRELALALARSGLSRIIVSLDGLTQESYEAYRQGGDIEKTLSGLRYLSEAKEQTHSHLQIVLQMLRLRSNEYEWSQAQSLYRRLGADRLEFKTAQLYDYENGHPLMPTHERFSRYAKGKDGRYHLRPSLSRRHPFLLPCHRLWTGCVVTTTGDILPCCYDKKSTFPMGNILQQGLRDIYHGEKAQQFKKHVLSGGQKPQICKNCIQ